MSGQLAEEKSTLEFQVQEAEVQLAELQETLTAATSRVAALEAEKAKNLAYQQEIEGMLLLVMLLSF